MMDGAASLVQEDNRERQDAMALEKIAARLTSAYPSDWYERFWQGPYLLYYTGVMFAATWIWMKTGSLWWALVPPAVWKLTMVECPRILLGRTAHAPRWAHSKAVLEPNETHQINRIVARIGPHFKNAVNPLLPVQSGDRFWIVLKQARNAWKKK